MSHSYLVQNFDYSSFFLILFFGIVLFIVIRELVVWYFKINRIVDLLEDIEENTRPVDVVREPYDKSGGLM